MKGIWIKMKKKNKRKLLMLMVLIITMTIFQGCTLAKEGKALEETQDKLIGAWVVLQKNGIDLAMETNLEDFKKEDAHVIYLDAYVKDEAQYLDLKTTGNIYGETTSYNIGENARGTDVTAKAYFSSSTPNRVVLLPIYQKANGERYSVGGNSWMSLGTDDQMGSFGSMFINSSYNETLNGKKTDEKVSFKIDFERRGDLAGAKLLYLDEYYNVLIEEELNLKNLVEQSEPAQLEVKESATMIVIEEEFINAKENKPYVVRSIYGPGMDDKITHNFILPIENNLAKMVEVEIIFNK